MTDKEAARLARREAAFLRAGATPAQALHAAGALFARDRDPMDTRRVCQECTHFRSGRCRNWRQAGFFNAQAAELGSDYARTLKHCPGFRLRGQSEAPISATASTAQNTNTPATG